MTDKRSLTSAANGAKSEGRPKVAGDSIYKRITLTISESEWNRFAEKCTAEGLAQSEVMRGLIRAWMEGKPDESREQSE